MPSPDGNARTACHRCGQVADAGEVSSGYPDHIWRSWCRKCLRENREAYRTAHNDGGSSALNG